MATKPPSTFAKALAWMAASLLIVFVLLGYLWYGFNSEVHHRIWSDVIDRSRGPMTFRFYLQPVMAALAALWDGIKDARLGRTPHLISLLTNASGGQQAREGILSIARIILLGLGMDTIYQLKAFDKFYPGEAVVITLLLAVIPYILLRGPISRVAQHYVGQAKEKS